MDTNFDILDYLNDIYMNRMAPTIDVGQAGGHHNIHGNDNNAKEEIAEKNKKRIHIPNAEIKHFQLGFEQDSEDDNEPDHDGSGDEQTGEDGTGHYEVFGQGTQKGGFSGSYTNDIVQISDTSQIKTLAPIKKATTEDITI